MITLPNIIDSLVELSKTNGKSQLQNPERQKLGINGDDKKKKRRGSALTDKFMGSEAESSQMLEEEDNS